MRIKPGYIIGLVVVGALVGAAPWVDGYYYKNSYTNLLTSLSADSPTKINIVSYRLGWMDSDVQLSIDFNPPNTKTPDPSYVVTIDQHITHGPFVKDPISGSWTMAEAALQSQVHLDKKTESKLIGDNTAGIVQIDTLASFDSHYQNQVKTPLFSVKISETGKFTWQGATGAIDATFVNNQLQHIKSDLTAGALAVQDVSGNLSIPEIKMQGERDCQQAALCGGSSDFSMAAANGMEGNVEAKMTGLSLKTSYGAAANDTYNASADFAMAKLTLPDYTVGPVKVQFSMSNLSATSMAKLFDMSRTMAESSGDDVQSQRLLMLAEYNKEAPHLVKANTVINQNTSIDTSYGNFKSVAKIYWPANTPLPATSADLVKMNFNVDMRAATTLVDQLVKVIDAKESSATASAAGADAPAAGGAGAAPPGSFVSPDESSEAIVVPTAAGANPADYAKALLAPYVVSKKISPDLVQSLVGLYKQNLSPAIYNASVDKLMFQQHLPRNVLKQIAQQLKNKYAANYTDLGGVAPDATAVTPASPASGPAGESVDAATPAVAAPAPDATSAPAVSPASAPAVGSGGRAKQQLDAMIKQGFIKQDNDDYVVSIVYENGTMKVNGAVIPLSLPATDASSATTQ